MFDPPLSESDLIELAPFEEALREEESSSSLQHPLQPIFAERAEAIAGRPIAVSVGVEESAHLIGLDALDVGLFDHGDEHSLHGTRPWLASVYAAFIHELAHVLHSQDFPDLDDARLRYAANLLEDGRAERRLVEAHPELRPWLRRNVLLGRAGGSLGVRAASEGWPHEFIVVGTRMTAGVITDEDYDELVRQVPAVVPVNDITNRWSQYLALDDGQLDADTVAALAEPLLPFLLRHHRA